MTSAPAVPRVEAVAAIGTSAMVGLATGFSTPLVSLRLDSMGTGSSLVGLAAAMPAVGFLVSAPLTQVLARRVRARRLLLGGTIGSACSILCLALTSDLTAWIVLRLCMGIATGILVIVGETWINALAPDSARGRLVAVYTTVFTLCQTTGPSLLAALGHEGTAPIVIAAAVQMTAAIPLLLASCVIGGLDVRDRMSLLGFMRAAPVIVVAVLAFAFFDSAVLAFLPLYGLDHGMTAATASIMVTIVFLGDTLFQIPLGWLADRFNRPALHRYCGVGMLAAALLLPLLMGAPILLWPALLVLGAAAGGIYTLGLVRMGDHFKGARLATANAAAGLVWGLGGVTGPLVGGGMIDAIGPEGLVAVLVLLPFAFLAATRASIRDGARVS
ncbi:MFS transporter [Microbispora bryophytorum]|uniref:MFS transporter n=1 Tax=Microbispora bryophytorum TaxID=1460882 RepID=UPI0033FA7A02